MNVRIHHTNDVLNIKFEFSTKEMKLNKIIFIVSLEYYVQDKRFFLLNNAK